MYNHLTGELDNRIAILPDSLQQPRVMDMVLGQYALVSLETVWVNETDQVRIDGGSDVESEESASPYDSCIYAVLLQQGIVLDFVQRQQDRPIKLDKISLARLIDEEDFDLSAMIDVVWVVTTEHEQDRLCEMYKEQTGRDLYDDESFDEEGGLVPVTEPTTKTDTIPDVSVTETEKKRRRLFSRGKSKGSQLAIDTSNLSEVAETK